MEGWKAVLRHILEHGKDFIDQEGRTCREVLNGVLTINTPQKDVDLPIQIMQQNEKWVYPQKEEIAQIMTSQRNQSAFAYTYGPRLFNYRGVFNQITEFILPLLTADPSSRRAVVTLYDALRDSKRENKDVPSLLFIHFKLDEGELIINAMIRSNDMFVGWPANIYQLHTLQKHVAQKLGVRTGAISTISVSAHIYEDHFEDVGRLLR